MSASSDLDVAVPDTELPDIGGEPSFRRIFVPVRSPGESADALATATRICRTINGVLQLVHVRIYDLPAARWPSRFYMETAAEAAALLDESLLIIWDSRARATTAVVDAPRGEVAVLSHVKLRRGAPT